MKCHVGVDAGGGLVHTMTVIAANEHAITQAAALVREDDEVVFCALQGRAHIPNH